MTDNFDEIKDKDNIEDLNNICEECGNEQENVVQNFILMGFKICNSCKILKTIYPL